METAGADISETRLNPRLIMNAALVAPSDVYQAVGVFVGQRLENDAVKDAEDRGVRSKAESQRKNNGECEDRSLQECSGAVAQVLPKFSHQFSPNYYPYVAGIF